MTNWRAVAVGVVLLVGVGTAGVSTPVVGQIGAGLAGGFAAGYLAGGSPGRGAWHGLVAGALAGLSVALVVGLFGGLVGDTAAGPLGVLVGGYSAFVTVSALTLLFAVGGAVAGAVGGWLNGRDG